MLYFVTVKAGSKLSTLVGVNSIRKLGLSDLLEGIIKFHMMYLDQRNLHTRVLPGTKDKNQAIRLCF